MRHRGPNGGPVEVMTMTDSSVLDAYGAVIERCFDLPKPSSLYFAGLGATASLVESAGVSPSFSAPMPYDNAFVLIIRLKAGVPFQLWIDGKFLPSGPLPAGSHSVLDQRSSPYCLGFGACRHVQFHLPRPQLNTLALQEGFAPIDIIDHRAGFAILDPALANLATIFESVLRGGPDAYDQLMTSYLAVAVASRLVSERGRRLRPGVTSAPPKLTPRQLSLAKDCLDSALAGEVSVFDLAALCDLPVRTFSRAFRASTGTSTSSWLWRRRIDRAIDLINRRALDLSRVATASGFGDIDRMDAAFLSRLGHPPAAFLDTTATSRYWRH